MNKSNATCFFLSVNLQQTKASVITNILTCILNIAFSLIAVSGNSIIVLVICKTRQLHSPSFLLLCCLAIADLLVGLVCQPCFVAFKITELLESYRLYCTLRMIHFASSWTASGVSLLTVSAVTLDRLVSLTLHLQYKTVITIPRVILAVLGIWAFCAAAVGLRFWTRNWIVLPVVVLLITFLVTPISTWEIFQTVRKHKRQINLQLRNVAHLQNNSRSINLVKCRKSAVTASYVYGLILLFYFPMLLITTVQSLISFTVVIKIMDDYSTTIAYINSSLNPFVYSWRIREIRRTISRMLRVIYKRYSPRVLMPQETVFLKLGNRINVR